MSTNWPGMDGRKTLCPFCLTVWQEHTLNQRAACMANLNQLFSEAMAASQSGASVSPSKVECPVCSKQFAKHAESDRRACASKRSPGTEELEFQGDFADASFKRQEPNPVKRGELQAQTRQIIVCSCGRPVGAHTVEEAVACARKQREGNAGGGV